MTLLIKNKDETMPSRKTRSSHLCTSPRRDGPIFLTGSDVIFSSMIQIHKKSLRALESSPPPPPARCMHILRTAKHVFAKSQKITSFRGKSWGLLVGKKLTASEHYFHSEKLGLCMYVLLQLQINLQLKKRDSSLLRTTLQAGCHETA